MRVSPMTEPTQPTRSPADVAKAEALAAKLDRKATDLLEPLAREIKLMGWKSEYATIMWEIVAHKAFARAKEAANGK